VTDACLRNFARTSAAMATFVVSCVALTMPVRAHDWYPPECCHSIDCASVESWSYTPARQAGALPQLQITTKHGTAVVPPDFPRRVSKDNRMHACMQSAMGSMQIVCVFYPPGT
jgi:hypothetical protein